MKLSNLIKILRYVDLLAVLVEKLTFLETLPPGSEMDVERIVSKVGKSRYELAPTKLRKLE